MLKDKKEQFIFICPDCAGKGKNRGYQCTNCDGLGVVLSLATYDNKLKNVLYYWGKKLNYLNIIQRRQQRQIRVIINFIFFLLGILGFLSLVKALFVLNSLELNLNNVIDLKNRYILWWWISLLIDMYLIYRINRESKVKYAVQHKPKLKNNIKNSDIVGFEWNKLDDYKKNDISQAFNNVSLKIIEDAWLLAHKAKHQYVQNIHLFTAMLNDTDINMVFARLGVDYKKIGDKIRSALLRIDEAGHTQLSGQLKKVLLVAYWRAYNSMKEKVNSTDLLYALAHNESVVQEILYEMSITEKEISHVVAWVDLQRWLIKKWHEFRYLARFKPKRAMNRTYTAIATPNLDAISRDMTIWARSGAYAPCIGRENKIDDIFRILEVDKLGALLVGPPGVGKRTIVEGIAQLMVREDVPPVLQDMRLVEISVSGLLAGATEAGQMEQRIITIMNEVAKSHNIVLFIEDIHHLVGVSTEGSEAMDAAEALAEQMQANNFMVLATTTPEFYKSYIENSSLAKAMQKVVVDEPDENESIQIIESKALFIEGKNQVYFSYQAIEKAVKLAKRYLHDEYLPEKAIKIVESTALAVHSKRGVGAIINKEDIAQVVANMTNVPVTKINVDESKRLLNLEERMHERIVGQDEAVRSVAMALRRARTELKGKNRPIASFLFLGPTGVGKTEVAKTLSRVYFGDEKNMIRVDMSEYQASDALPKLIGDAQTNTGGYLTEAVKKKPFSLVLLDEFEKAKLDILNVFLQVLDDGRLTDATGKTIDFTNSIIIGTSNAGTEYIQESIRQGKTIDKIKETLINDKLKTYFKPELLNRFDGIVVFKPLEMSQVEQIAHIFIAQLASRLEEKGIELIVNDGAIKKLAQAGFDPTLGARPLRRVIQDKLEDKLAKLFLAKQIDRRDKVIIKDNLEIEVEKAERI